MAAVMTDDMALLWALCEEWGGAGAATRIKQGSICSSPTRDTVMDIKTYVNYIFRKYSVTTVTTCDYVGSHTKV